MANDPVELTPKQVASLQAQSEAANARLLAVERRRRGAVAMPVNSLGSFDPEALLVLYQAFDDVWLQLEDTTGPDARDATRNAIAAALIQAAMRGERDPEKLWCHAMSRARALRAVSLMEKTEPLSPSLPRAGARLLRRA